MFRCFVVDGMVLSRLFPVPRGRLDAMVMCKLRCLVAVEVSLPITFTIPASVCVSPDGAHDSV